MSEYLKSQIEIGHFIKKMRENNGYKTSKELAQKLGVSVVTVSNWENGTKAPSYIYYSCLSNIFNISIDDILAANDPYAKYNDVEIKKFDFDAFISIKNLDMKKRKALVLEYIDYRMFISNYIDDLINGKDTDDEVVENIINVNYYLNVKNEPFILFYKDGKKFNVNDLPDNIFKNKQIIEIKKNYKPFINNEVFYKDPLNEIVDKKGNKAFYKIISLSFTQLFMNYGDKFNEYISWILKTSIDEEDLRYKLNFMYKNYDYYINDINELIFFEEDCPELIDKYIGALSTVEKYKLLIDYIDNCQKKNLLPKTDVIYHFLVNGTKILYDYSFNKIKFDDEKTINLYQIVLKFLYEKKTNIDIGYLNKNIFNNND